MAGKFSAGIATSFDKPSAVEQLQSNVPQATPTTQEVAPEATPKVEDTGFSDPVLDAVINGEYEAFKQQADIEGQRSDDFDKSAEGQYTQTPEGKAQLENEKIDSVRKRYHQGFHGERINTYQRKAEAQSKGVAFQSKYGRDGGIFDRAKNLPKQVNNFQQNPDGTFESLGSIVLGTQIGRDKALLGEGAPLPQTLQDIGAVQGTGRKETIQFDSDFLTIGSLVTEDFLAQEFSAKKKEDMDSFEPEIMEEDIELAPGAYAKKQSQNAQLGRKIHEEFVKETRGESESNLSEEQATLLGDMFKEVYAKANPDMVNRKQVGSQVQFELTNVGVEKMNDSSTARRLMFPKEHVRTLKSPSPTGRQVGEGKKITKKVTGAKKSKKNKRKAENHRRTNQAVKNLASIPNVVDKQREKILYSTMLPVLQGAQNPLSDLFGTVNNLGQAQANKFNALEKQDAELRASGQIVEGKPYSAFENMEALKNKAAQEIFGIATERNGANYLTYTVQGFAGRLTPNQTHFNPTTSKPVRFVTRNATPVEIKRGGRTDQNLRQMYAMMLVKDADTLLPVQRELAVKANTFKLAAWGKRLNEVLNNSMTDSELEAVATAIQQGIALNDPKFPKVKGLQLDPEKDAQLIEAIANKGEDGQHFIDGLIDFYKYDTAMTKGLKHYSYFNAYIDGKTNGLAAMGLQMGSIELALSTGVLRTNDINLLDDGDIRDQLADNLNARLEDTNNGLEGISELDDVKTEMYDVAKGIFNWRDFNKKTTMVFGYGMDISGFKGMMDDFSREIQQAADGMDATGKQRSKLDNFSMALDIVNSKIAELNKMNGTTYNVGDYLLLTYESAIMDVLDPDAIHSRGLMKASAFYAAMANRLFEIDGPGGFPLKFGGVDESTLGNVEERIQYMIDGQKKEAVMYAKAEQNARSRKGNVYDDFGFIVKEGKLNAVGAAVPGPIHATDAYAITNTVTGASWAKLNKASKGNPYFHSIYDAVKMDANGYDVILEELNQNWFDANTQWSFLKAMSESVEELRTEMTETAKAIDPKSTMNMTDIDPFFAQLLEVSMSKKGNLYPSGAIEVFSYINDSEIAYQHAKSLMQAMKNQGFDMTKEPETITGRQLQELYSYFLRNFNIKQQLDAHYEKVKGKQKKLIAEINKQGVKNYQYYAH